jgi:hypothetical protein
MAARRAGSRLAVAAAAAALSLLACDADVRELAMKEGASGSGSAGSGGGAGTGTPCSDAVSGGGCSPGLKCTLDCATRSFLCLRAGSKTARQACAADSECAAGTGCLNRVCVKFCNGSFDCPAGQTCTGQVGCPGDTMPRLMRCQ